MSQRKDNNRTPNGTPKNAAELRVALETVQREIAALKSAEKPIEEPNGAANADAPNSAANETAPRAAAPVPAPNEEIQALKKAFSAAKWRTMVATILAAVAISSFMVAQEATAWFSMNKTAGSNAMTIDIRSIPAHAEYWAYIYDAKLGKVLYTGDPHDEYPDPSIRRIDMQFHDMIFKIRNRYTPALIRIELNEIEPKWENGGTVFLTLSRDLTKPATVTDGSETRLGDYFTSVMRFTLAQNSDWYPDALLAAESDPTWTVGGALYEISDAALYSTYRDKVGNSDESKVFTAVSGASFTKEDTIVLEAPYTASDIIDGTLNLYLYITYDQTLLDSYQTVAGITGDQAIGRTVTMTDDIEKMSVSFGAASE